MEHDPKNIFPLGVDYETGQPLFKQTNLEDFLKQQNETFSSVVIKKQETVGGIREEIKKIIRDITEPISVGWIYVLPRDHPEKQKLKHKMESLAKHRGMIGEPLEFHFENNNILTECQSWIDQVYGKTNFNGTKRPPLYILLVGNAQQIPFELQWLLQSVALVGRITDDILDAYITKILRLESAKNPVPTQKAVFFAPSKDNDPTYYSNLILATPIVTQVEALGYHVSFLPRDDEATKQHLKQSLETASNVALVFTASHGIGGASVPPAIQQQVNGAILCNPPQNNSSPTIDELIYAVSDVPPDHSKPFLEGSIFFQFACFGYGTPKQSHFSHWYHNNCEYLTSQDFIAALPQKLLSHPKGPIAFIGHVDTSWLHGITDPNNALVKTRREPFEAAIDSLLHSQPVGVAMEVMNNRFNQTGVIIAGQMDSAKSGKSSLSLDDWANNYVIHNDARNYMIFGDPACQIRITKNTTFKWSNGGNQVLVAGSWDNWQHEIPLKKVDEGRFVIEHQIPSGTYEYKFKVDEDWQLDPNIKETVASGINTKNHLLVVS